MECEKSEVGEEKRRDEMRLDMKREHMIAWI